LLWEVVGHWRLTVAVQGEGFKLAAAGSAADAEIDAVGKHGVQRAKDFRDFERGIVWEHDPAGAYADALGFGGGARDEDFGRGAGEEVHGVVFGVPEARVTELVDMASKVERVGQGLRGR